LYKGGDNLKNVSLIIAYRPDQGPRDQIFKHVRRFYAKYFPKMEICIGESDTELFNKSQAINRAAKRARGDILVIVDADVIFAPTIISKSIELLENSPLIIPFQRIHYINETNTKKILETGQLWPINGGADNFVVDATNGNYEYISLVNVIKRETFEAIGGYDERFYGWGGEDDAFNVTVNTMCGNHIRLNQDVYHLWHPPAPGNHHYSKERHVNYRINMELRDRFFSARGDKEEIQHLIKEKSYYNKANSLIDKSNRFLVIGRVGNRSEHRQWSLPSSDKNFDLLLDYYEDGKDYQSECDFFTKSKEMKWPSLYKIVDQWGERILKYDAVWFLDGDVILDAETINQVFLFFMEHQLLLAQPALSECSNYSHDITKVARGNSLRLTNYVESRIPIFSKEALSLCWHTFSKSQSGWGLDFIWPKILGNPEDRIAIIDKFPVKRHKPFYEPNYDEGSAWDELYVLCNKYETDPFQFKTYASK
jgi:glycosyltransferase involved in cell wall biosynthesis